MAPANYPTIRQAMSIADIAKRSGLSGETIRAYHKKKRPGFPRPAATIGRTPVWEAAAIDEWIDNR